MKIKLIKFRDDLIHPCRAHYNDAGIDCYALDDFDLPPMSNKEPNEAGINTKPNQTVLIPLGFGLELPDGYMATIRPRSSMNKRGILTQIGTIDSGYRGEISCGLCNLTNYFVKIKAGERICQLVIEPVILAEFVDDLKNNRGTGGFGSTGR